MGTIISAVVDGILKAAIGWLQAIQQRRDDVRSGQTQQAAAETAASERTEAAISKAEADAPQDKAAVLDRLAAGNG